ANGPRRGRPTGRGLRHRHVRGRRLRGAHAGEGVPRRVRRGRLRPSRRPGRVPKAVARGPRGALEEEPRLLREEDWQTLEGPNSSRGSLRGRIEGGDLTLRSTRPRGRGGGC